MDYEHNLFLRADARLSAALKEKAEVQKTLCEERTRRLDLMLKMHRENRDRVRDRLVALCVGVAVGCTLIAVVVHIAAKETSGWTWWVSVGCLALSYAKAIRMLGK